MPLNVRSISFGIAVMTFFGISVIGAICNLSPFTCCKRAVIGMILVYIVSSFVVKTINIVLVDAIITKQVNQKLQQQKRKG